MTRTVAVDIADLKVSADPDVTLVTFALGSCIGVTAYDPVKHVAGLLHFQLPLSEANPEKATHQPGMFGDTGFGALLDAMTSAGCRKGNLVVKVMGGAKCYEDHGMFDIGRRNYVVLRKLLWKQGLPIAAEDVGGTCSRTVRINVGDGAVTISKEGRQWSL